MMLRAPSIAEIHEHELVNMLVREATWFSSLLREIVQFPTNPVVLVRENFEGLSNERKGDIDVLLWQKDRPSDAIAIEVKRVKVSKETFKNGLPNRLSELEEAARQTRLLAELGFSQIYLYVLVVVDAREQNAGRVTYEGMTQQIKERIRNAVFQTTLPLLHSRVGLMQCEFVQPTDDAPLQNGFFGAELLKRSQATVQPKHLTEWVRLRAKQDS